MNKKYLEQALIEDPTGEFCAQCGELNTFADDCGFFYNEIEDKGYVAVCECCNNMPAGDR